MHLIASFIGKTFNKTVRFFIKEQKRTNNKILIFISSYSFFSNMTQRPEHLFDCFVKNGYTVAWSEKAVNRVVELKKNIYLFPLKDAKKLATNIYLSDRVIMSISTHYTCKQLEKILFSAQYTGAKIIFEHLDDISLIENSKRKKELSERLKSICNNENILVSTTADSLYKQAVELRGSDKNIVIAKNTVDLETFSDYLKPRFRHMIDSKKPLIGYYGVVSKSWFDFNLLEYALQKCPEMNFVLIGPHDEGVGQLKKYDNFLCLDKMPLSELLKYSKHFSVGIIPFLLNDITKGTSPVKMFEYMAHGIPVVTTALAECIHYKSCLIAADKEDFVRQLHKAIELKHDNGYLQLLKEETYRNTWDNTFETIISVVNKM